MFSNIRCFDMQDIEMNDLSTQQSGASDDPKKMRAGYFENIFETTKHIQNSIASEGKRLRTSDYVSIILLPIFALLLAVFAANVLLTSYRPVIVGLFFATLLYFI